MFQVLNRILTVGTVMAQSTNFSTNSSVTNHYVEPSVHNNQ